MAAEESSLGSTGLNTVVPRGFLAEVHLVLGLRQLDTEDEFVCSRWLLLPWRRRPFLELAQLVVVSQCWLRELMMLLEDGLRVEGLRCALNRAVVGPAEPLSVELPRCSLLLAQRGPLEVHASAVRTHRVEQVAVRAQRPAKHVIILRLLQLLPRPVEECLLDLQAELLEEVDFLVIQVVIVED